VELGAEEEISHFDEVQHYFYLKDRQADGLPAKI
jgi:hypothetical protein